MWNRDALGFMAKPARLVPIGLGTLMTTNSMPLVPTGQSSFCSTGDSRRVAIATGCATFLAMIPVTLVVPVLKELVADRYGASTFWTVRAGPELLPSCNPRRSGSCRSR